MAASINDCHFCVALLDGISCLVEDRDLAGAITGDGVLTGVCSARAVLAIAGVRVSAVVGLIATYDAFVPVSAVGVLVKWTGRAGWLGALS